MSKDVKIKLYTPTQPQADAIDIIYNKKPSIMLMVYGRQTGKTYFMIMDAITYALNGSGVDVAFISPTYQQNANVMEKVDALFYGRKEVKDIVFKQVKYKEQKYYFHNGSTIEFMSAEQGDAIRGRTKHRVYVDEMAFMKRSFIFKIVLPFLTRTGGQLIGASTFNGRNWFYKLSDDGQDKDNEKTIISIKRTYLDLEDEDVNRVVEAMRQSMTKEEFLQEVMCNPISKETLFIDVESAIGEAKEENNNSLFIGIDIGISNDYTVVTVMNHKYEVVDVDRFNIREDHLTSKEYKERLLKLYRKHFQNIVAAYIEINNNELLYDDLMDNYNDTYKILPFITTATNKPKLISNLIKLFEDNEIVIPNDEELIAELYGYKAKRNEITGKLQYKNDGVDHDDMVMSLAIAAYCVKEESDSGIIEFV